MFLHASLKLEVYSFIMQVNMISRRPSAHCKGREISSMAVCCYTLITVCLLKEFWCWFIGKVMKNLEFRTSCFPQSFASLHTHSFSKEIIYSISCLKMYKSQRSSKLRNMFTQNTIPNPEGFQPFHILPFCSQWNFSI